MEDDGVGHWIKTPIKINIPFHKRMLNPGLKEFNAGTLYHRQLTSVIREKLTRPSTHPHLHFEPYNFYWQPSEAAELVRVYGELFTSEAFIKAHHELQESPGEPGCDLPRVVIGLMFASDGTQLTSFSTAKLWPVYLMIGNESKDQRSKPSCHAFEHVAYLEMVCDGFMQMIIWNWIPHFSFLMLLLPLQQRTLVARVLTPPFWHTLLKNITMLNGHSSLMMTFWRHISIEWWWM